MICHVFRHGDELCYNRRYDINNERHQEKSSTLRKKKKMSEIHMVKSAAVAAPNIFSGVFGGIIFT